MSNAVVEETNYIYNNITFTFGNFFFFFNPAVVQLHLQAILCYVAKFVLKNTKKKREFKK